MNNALYNFATARRLLGALLVAQLALTTPLHAASMALATAPLATSTTSTVQPNIMFILDDSGSMDWNYLPDWATSGSANLAKNANYNGVAYNPAINFKPPVLFSPMVLSTLPPTLARPVKQRLQAPTPQPNRTGNTSRMMAMASRAHHTQI